MLNPCDVFLSIPLLIFRSKLLVLYFLYRYRSSDCATKVERDYVVPFSTKSGTVLWHASKIFVTHIYGPSSYMSHRSDKYLDSLYFAANEILIHPWCGKFRGQSLSSDILSRYRSLTISNMCVCWLSSSGCAPSLCCVSAAGFHIVWLLRSVSIVRSMRPNIPQSLKSFLVKLI